MTMWAIATGNSKLEGLGRLQTGVLARSVNEYFLLKDDNTNHPADYVRNKVNLGDILFILGMGLLIGIKKYFS